MKLKVYNNEYKDDETYVYLKLVEGSEYIKLVACDKNGNNIPAGNILEISKEGIMRYTSLSDDLGFKLDKGDRIALNE